MQTNYSGMRCVNHPCSYNRDGYCESIECDNNGCQSCREWKLPNTEDKVIEIPHIINAIFSLNVQE